MRRRLVLGAAALVAVAAVVVAMRPGGGDGEAAADEAEPTTATVRRTDLVQREELDGTLGFRELDGALTSGRAGTLTALAAEGDVVPIGGSPFAVDGEPVLLLRGEEPATRDLVQGMAGEDVRRLEATLVSLGLATWDQLVDDGRFGAATARAVRELQRRAGAEPTGVLRHGDAIFAPTDVRIGDHALAVGAALAAGAAVTAATADEQVVSVALPATRQGRVQVGDAVEVELPNDEVVAGTVEAVATVATVPEDGGSPTFALRISLDDPASAPGLDQTPVDVSIETNRAEGVLAVPVRALVALAEGGYGVEVVGTGGKRSLVGVELGTFSDTDDLVEVEGAGLREGMTVVTAP